MYIPIAESLAALQLAAAGSAQTPQLAIEAPVRPGSSSSCLLLRPLDRT